MDVVAKRVTLLELARAAGTSPAAASYALNNQPGVSDATRRRILETAQRIGYRHRPSRHARSMQTRRVSVALSPTRRRGETPNYFVSELLAGVDHEAQRRGVRLDTQIWTTDWAKARPARTDGALYLGGAFDPNVIAGTDIPTVLVGTSFPEIEVDSVLADNSRGIYLSAMHLLEQGCRRLTLMNGPEHAATSGSKLAGFRDALGQFGLDMNDADVVNVDFDPTASETAATSLLARPERPDGIVAADDVIAIGALHAAMNREISVPIVGFGDSPTAELVRPSLSSVRVFLHQMGQIGLRRLLERLDADEEVPVMRSLVSTRLVVRESSAVAR